MMSGIKFVSDVSEGENLSLGSRPRPKKRRSSILKSPSRNALHDIDPNAEERDTTSYAKKKRRSSRRVSFANTYQVQEFLTANQLKILEDTSKQQEAIPPTSPEKDFPPSVPSTTSSSSLTQDARNTPTLQGDISVGPGHCIRGLETLLSGPIKKQPHSYQESICNDPIQPRTILQPAEGAIHLPAIEETCEVPVDAKVASGTSESADPGHQDVEGTQNWPEPVTECDKVSVGLLGPSYHCALPVADSFSSSCHSSFSGTSANHYGGYGKAVDLDDTASFELTICREQYLAADTVFEQPEDPVIKKQDASSFLKSLMGTDQDDDACSPHQPLQSTFPDSAIGDGFEIKPAKLDSKDFLKLFMSFSSPQSSFPAPSSCTSDDLSLPKSQARDNSRDNLGQTDFTTFSSGAKKERHAKNQTSCDLPQAEEASAPQTKNLDMTVRFGDDCTGNMELTQCIQQGQLEPEKLSSQKRGRGTRPLEDITRIFDGAEMDLTVCTNHPSTTLTSHLHSGNQTRIFQHEDATAAMEMTCSLGDPVSSSKSGDTDKAQVHPDAESEKTRIFGHDATASMEMTTCVTGQEYFVCSSNSNTGTDSSIALRTNSTPEKTTIFRCDETTADMEMTSCFRENVGCSSIRSLDSHSPKSCQPKVEVETTRIFHRDEETAAMEMTACFGKPSTKMLSINTTIPHVDSKINNEPSSMAEETRIFQHDDVTAVMEMTECLHKKPSFSNPGIANSQSDAAYRYEGGADTLREDQLKQGKRKSVLATDRVEIPVADETLARDKTQIFRAEDTAGMDFTTCIGGVLVEPSSQQRKQTKTSTTTDANQTDHDSQEGVPYVSGGFSSALPTFHQGDLTRNFTSDDTARMEMTTCVGSLLTNEDAYHQPSSKQADSTKIFTQDDAAQMELTACISSLQPLPSVVSTSVKKAPKAARGDETGKMEMTACVGGIFPKMYTDPSQDESAKPLQDHTKIFSTDDGGSMDMTTCLGSLTCSSQTLNDGTQPSHINDQTRVFTSDDTARMEITTCFGGLVLKTSSDKTMAAPGSAESTVAQSNPTEMSPQQQDLPEHTHIFNSDSTASMEMTTCIGDINGKVQLTHGHSGEGFPDTSCHGGSPVEQTRLFAQHGTGKIELTSCIGGINEMDITRSSPDKSASDSSGRSLKDCQAGRMIRGVKEESREEDELQTAERKGSSDLSDCQAAALTELQNACSAKPEAVVTNENDESPDHTPLADSSGIPAEEVRSTKRDSDTFTIKSSFECRRSDTYTLDKPPAATTATAESSTNQVSPREEGAVMMDDLNRWGSVDSSEGIDNEQPVWVENTEDFSQLSAEAGVARLMLMEAIKDKTDLEDAFDLSLFAKDADQGKREASNLQDAPDNSHLVLDGSSQAKAATGPVSMQDFLAFVTLDLPKGRRSIISCMPPVTSQKTLSDFMEDHFILKPKTELYKWAVGHLSSSIEKLQDAVNEQEQHMSEENPDIVKEVQLASPEKATKLHDYIEALHRACTKKSRASFKEWRLKMVMKTNQFLKQTEEEMNNILSTLTTSLDTINVNQEELRKYKDGLDGTLAGLKRVEPPSEEQVKEFLEQRERLALRQAEMEEMKMNKAALEREASSLKSDIKRLEKELADTEDEQIGLSQQTSSGDGLEEALAMLENLHCLQDWRLRKYSEEEMIFSFLEDSLVFVVKLGTDKDSGKGNCSKEKAILGLHMESLLADDANVCARLAHNLVQASIDVALLHSQHPSTATLKLLLQEVSIAVSQADGIADEMDAIRYRHVITIDGTNPTVEFSNLDAMVKFWVTFDLLPGSYPFKAISANFKHKIGNLGEEELQSALSQVHPGYTYISRLVASIDSLIKQHVPPDL